MECCEVSAKQQKQKKGFLIQKVEIVGRDII